MTTNHFIIRCSSCGAKNRIPVERAGESPKCGKCGASLKTEDVNRPVNATDASFDKLVFGSALPVLVDCWAPWCGPCKAVGPVLDQLATEYKGRLKIVKVNVDENPGISQKYSISSIPTMFLVKQGKVVDQLVGALPKQELVKQIERIV